MSVSIHHQNPQTSPSRPGPYNAVVQAAWSPRVCIVRRKTSRCALADPRRTAYERAVTFEGPSHHTEEGPPPPFPPARAPPLP